MPKTLPDGRIEIEKGDTLYDIYGSDWKNASGYSDDPTQLQIGSVLPAIPQPQKDPVSTLSTDDGEEILDQTKKKFDTQYGLEDETAKYTRKETLKDGTIVGYLPDGNWEVISYDTNNSEKKDDVDVEEEEEEVKDKEDGYSFEEAQEIWGNDFTGIRRGADGLFYPDSSAYERAGIKGLETDEDLSGDLSDEVDEMDTQIEDEYNKWQDYNVETDPAFTSQQNAITAQYATLRRQMEQKNEARQRAFETMGIRGGTRMYAGQIQLGIEGLELSQAGQRLNEIATAELAAKSAARIAFENNEYTRFSQKVDALQKIRNNKADALKAYNEALKNTSDVAIAQAKEERAKLEFALKVNRFEREGVTWEREETEAMAENVSKAILDLMSEDVEKNKQIIQRFAERNGIPFETLFGEIKEAQTEKRMENLKVQKLETDVIEATDPINRQLKLAQLANVYSQIAIREQEDKGTDKIREITNTAKFIPKDDLTAAEQKQINVLLGGFKLVDQVEKLYNQAVGEESKSANWLGGMVQDIKGKFRKLDIPFTDKDPVWTQTYRIYDNFLNSNRAPVAKGLKGEVGNLTENEQKQALKSFPDQNSTPREAEASFENIRKQMIDKLSILGEIEGELNFDEQSMESELDNYIE